MDAGLIFLELIVVKIEDGIWLNTLRLKKSEFKNWRNFAPRALKLTPHALSAHM
jgi:hypothetical protein